MDVRQLVESKARAARAAAHALAVCGTRVKDEALAQMARALEEKSAALLEANRADLERARAKGLTRAFLDRLTLSEARIEEMANGLRQIGRASCRKECGDTSVTGVQTCALPISTRSPCAARA